MNRQRFCDWRVFHGQWMRINCKQSYRWQHLSQLKASAFFSMQKNSCMQCNNLHSGLVTPSCGWWSPIATPQILRPYLVNGVGIEFGEFEDRRPPFLLFLRMPGKGYQEQRVCLCLGFSRQIGVSLQRLGRVLVFMLGQFKTMEEVELGRDLSLALQEFFQQVDSGKRTARNKMSN